MASNDGLAADFRQNFPGVRCITIPDRIKLDAYPTRREHTDTEPVRLIWFGNPENRPVLWAAIPAIERAAAHGRRIALTIFDDGKAGWTLRGVPVYNLPWKYAIENDVISSHDIAVLPVHPGIHGAVKSDNKTLTAYANGLPVTGASDYRDFLRLIDDPDYRQAQADAGYELLARRGDVRQSAAEWREVLGL